MKKILIILFAVSIYAIPSNSQIINREPLSDRQTCYKIDAKLDPVTKTVTATMHAFWVNKSADIVPDVQLHLYMNAFRSSRTTMYKELSGSLDNIDYEYGFIDIKSLTNRKGINLIPEMNFISPDDGNL